MRRGYVWRVALAALLVLSIAVSPALADEEDEEDAGDGDEQEAVQTWSEGNLAGILYVTKSAGNCDEYTVQTGDTVTINHAGFEDVTHKQFDSNGKEPFKVKLGSGTVITGMEEGMVGMCKGEVRMFRFAPHVAFDDPNKRFSRKPVKTGQAVLYQIEVLGVLRPFTLPWYKEVAAKQVGVPGLVGCLVLAWAAYEAYKFYKRAQKRGKKKAK